MNKELLRMSFLAGIITEGEYKQELNENYSLNSIKSILSSNISSEDKMDKIGDFLTDTPEGEELSNTNLGNPVDMWFSTKRNADKWLAQIQSLINNPKNIKDISQELNENFQIGDTVNIGDSDMGPGEIISTSDYISNKREIDRSIRNTGWEMLDTPKEELTWYKVELESGDIIWYDEDELLEYN
jgi:hypothetical protein